jgi:hypothetical protein
MGDSHEPFGCFATVASTGKISGLSKVTSTTWLGVPENSKAGRKVFGPLGLFAPFEHRGEPELYLQNLG